MTPPALPNPERAQLTTEQLSTGERRLNNGYDTIQHLEAREPQPDDELLIGHLSPDNQEYKALQSIGVSAESLANGIATREQLQAAGFFFINRLGGNEKYIIGAEIEDPDKPGHQLDFSRRVLLTESELKKVYKYQQTLPEYSLQGQDIDAVRKDMLLFLHTATQTEAFPNSDSFIAKCVPFKPSPSYFDGQEHREQWKLVDKFWRKQIKEYSKTHPGVKSLEAERACQQAFVQEHFNDLYSPDNDTSLLDTKTVRGHSTQSLFEIRRDKLSRNGSPFLESGFSFQGIPNLDANVYPEGPPDPRSHHQRRLNMAVLHIAGGHPDFPGLSEMGGDQDQVYMPIGTYAAELFPTTPEAQEERDREIQLFAAPSKQEIIAAAQERMIGIATSYFNERRLSRRLAKIATRLFP